MTTYEERRAAAAKAKSEELKRRRNKFLDELTDEMVKRGHEVERQCHVVDGHNTGIVIKEQNPGGPWSTSTGNGKLHVTFCLGYGKFWRAYSAPEGKNGFNVQKAADALEKQLVQKREELNASNERERRHEESRHAAKRIRDELNITEYSTPNVEVDRQGKLTMKMGYVTEDEARTLLKTLLEMRKQ